jgi:hypothetical protein
MRQRRRGRCRKVPSRCAAARPAAAPRRPRPRKAPLGLPARPAKHRPGKLHFLAVRRRRRRQLDWTHLGGGGRGEHWGRGKSGSGLRAWAHAAPKFWVPRGPAPGRGAAGARHAARGRGRPARAPAARAGGGARRGPRGAARRGRGRDARAGRARRAPRLACRRRGAWPPRMPGGHGSPHCTGGGARAARGWRAGGEGQRRDGRRGGAGPRARRACLREGVGSAAAKCSQKTESGGKEAAGGGWERCPQGAREPACGPALGAAAAARRAPGRRGARPERAARGTGATRGAQCQGRGLGLLA